MKIKRSIKLFPGRAKAGTVEVINETKMREIAGQTELARHAAMGDCGKAACGYCPELAMRRIEEGYVLETFYATYELAA